jgi:Abortive infection alpha
VRSIALVEPLTTGAAIVGLGWAGKKVLGPSFDELGEQLRIYLSGRMSKIFRRMDDIGISSTATPLPPGFTYLAIQKASFSEDEERITEMWARLLIDAATEYKPRHPLIADILGQLTSDEAIELDRIVPADYIKKFSTVVPVNVKTSLRLQFENLLEPLPRTLEDTERVLPSVMMAKPHWPSIVTNVHLPYLEDPDNKISWYGGGQGVSTSHDVLVRQGLLERFNFDLNSSMPPPTIEGLMITGLGLEFLSACRKTD